MTESIIDLVLAGYVPLRSQGLALPCYSSGPHSNAWYCAVCSIDGDHSGYIRSFEPFDADDIIRLPARAARAVSVGDAWHDVLLWTSEVYVGTPTIIMSQLGTRFAEIAAQAPLTLLDIAMACHDIDQAALIQAAYLHVKGHWGRDEAERWQSDVFVRQRLMVEARRILAAAGENLAADVIRKIEVNPTGALLSVDLPDELGALFHAHKIYQVYAERVAAVSNEIGISLAPIIARDKESAQPETSPITTTVDLVERRQMVRSDDEPARVLIIASSGRARLLIRYIRSPDWRPEWDGRETQYPLPQPADYIRPTKWDVVAEGSDLPKLDQYTVIIYVADEKAFFGDTGRVTQAQIQTNFSDREAPLCILAPTLPAQKPASLLANQSTGSATKTPLFRTILDTATVRSPFWVGNSKRSIDRRLADLISATAQLVQEGSPIHAWLTQDRPSNEPLLLSVASGIKQERSEAVLASEISSASLDSEAVASGGAETFAWAEIPLGGERKQVFHGRAIIRQHAPDFHAFVEAVVGRGRPDKLLSPYKRVAGEVPVQITEALQYPHLSAAFRAQNVTRGAICMISAESPNLKALRAAAEAGWGIVRYTDEEGLKSIVTKHGKQDSPLPSDISMPQLNRLGRNRGLAIRGIDPRDVLQIPVKVYEDLRGRFPDSELVKTARLYRSDISQGLDGIPAPINVAVIPTAFFAQARARHEEWVRILEEHDQIETGSIRLLAKRTSDLKASWAGPVDGSQRLMFEDGELPVRIGRLERNEVAAQKFFTIDGDAGVILLFSSRLFRVWARATLSRSPSWSSRFSITRTFETFPIPDDFVVADNTGDVRPSLRANPSSRLLKTLLDGFDDDIFIPKNDYMTAKKMWEQSERRREHIKAADPIFMEMIGLPVEASDLDLLERLVEMNRNAGSASPTVIDASDQWSPDIPTPYVGAPGNSAGMDTLARINGTVKWFDLEKGYGFLKPDDQDRDVVVHITALQEAGLDRLKDNQRVSFEMVNDRNGKKSAGSLQLINS